MENREKLREEIIRTFDARLAKYDELNRLIPVHHFKHYDVNKRDIIDVTEGAIQLNKHDTDHYDLFIFDSLKVYSIAGDKYDNNREYLDDFYFLEYNDNNDLINFFGFNGVFVSQKLFGMMMEIINRYRVDLKYEKVE